MAQKSSRGPKLKEWIYVTLLFGSMAIFWFTTRMSLAEMLWIKFVDPGYRYSDDNRDAPLNSPFAWLSGLWYVVVLAGYFVEISRAPGGILIFGINLFQDTIIILISTTMAILTLMAGRPVLPLEWITRAGRYWTMSKDVEGVQAIVDEVDRLCAPIGVACAIGLAQPQMLEKLYFKYWVLPAMDEQSREDKSLSAPSPSGKDPA